LELWAFHPTLTLISTQAQQGAKKRLLRAKVCAFPTGHNDDSIAALKLFLLLDRNSKRLLVWRQRPNSKTDFTEDGANAQTVGYEHVISILFFSED
jgi:hypothetical protein